MKNYCTLIVLGSVAMVFALNSCIAIIIALVSYFSLIVFTVCSIFGMIGLGYIARLLISKGVSKKDFLKCVFIPQAVACGYHLISFLLYGWRFILLDGWERMPTTLTHLIYVLICVVMFIGVLCADLSSHKVQADRRKGAGWLVGWSVFLSLAIGLVIMMLFPLSLIAVVVISCLMVKPMRNLALRFEQDYGIGNQRFCRCVFLPPIVIYAAIVIFITAIDEWGGSILFWIMGICCFAADMILLIGVSSTPSNPVPQGGEPDGAVSLEKIIEQQLVNGVAVEGKERHIPSEEAASFPDYNSVIESERLD